MEPDKIKTLIVDDEKPARGELAYLLGKFSEIEIIGEAENGKEACAKILEKKPDLVMLDIQMPGIDGFQALNRLITKTDLPHIIFVTAYDEYAVHAFEVNAVDYLLKPVEESRLRVSIERVKTAMEKNTGVPDGIQEILQTLSKKRDSLQRISIKKGNHYHVINVDDIYYISIEEGVVRVVEENISGTTTYRSLDELHQELDGKRFHRAHRAYIVNIDKIEEIIPWFSGSYKLRLSDAEKTEIPLSRAQARQLRKILKW